MSTLPEETKVIKPFGSSNPVFPTENILRNSYGDISERTTVPGITKREYFAAMAMQGVLAASGDTRLSPSWVANEAVQYADELLKELAK